MKSDYHCVGCKSVVYVELPGRVIWHLPLDDAEAAGRLRFLEAVDKVDERSLRNLRNAGRAYAAAEAAAAKIKAWQANGMVHPLTCGQDSRHRILVPAATTSGVILSCRDCNYQQLKIPAIVTWTKPNHPGEMGTWADRCLACKAGVILTFETFSEEVFRLGLMPPRQEWTCPKCEAQQSQGLPGTIRNIEMWSSRPT